MSIFLPIRRFKKLNRLAERLKKREKIVLESHDKFINLSNLIETTIINFKRSTQKINISYDSFNMYYNIPIVQKKFEVTRHFKNTSTYYEANKKIVGPIRSNTELISATIKIEPSDYRIKGLVKPEVFRSIVKEGRYNSIKSFNNKKNREIKELSSKSYTYII